MTTRTPAISVAQDAYGRTLFTFADGRELKVDVDSLDPSIQREAMIHGIKQKLLDAGAIARNTETGRSATVDDKYEAVAEVHARITGPSPTWNKGRSGGDGASTLLVQALVRLYGKPRAVVVAWLDGKTKEERAELRKNDKIISAIAEIQRETAGDTSASDAMLDELA